MIVILVTNLSVRRTDRSTELIINALNCSNLISYNFLENKVVNWLSEMSELKTCLVHEHRSAVANAD